MKKQLIPLVVGIFLLVSQIAIMVAYSVDTNLKTEKKIVPKRILLHFESRGKPADTPGNGPGNGNGNGGGGGGSDDTSGGSSGSGDKYALVIGISDYEGTSNDLEYCDDDARDWADYLKSLGYQVKILLDSQATADAITDAINWLLSVEDSPDDAIVFAYSGHGYHDPKYGSMILSHDMVGITESYFDDAFSQLDSQHAFFFFDACQIGGMKVLADTEVGRYVAMGSNEHSYSYDGTSDMQNGIFTYYFLEDGIKQKGYQYMEDAFDYAAKMCKKVRPDMKPTEADTFSGGLEL